MSCLDLRMLCCVDMTRGNSKSETARIVVCVLDRMLYVRVSHYSAVVRIVKHASKYLEKFLPWKMTILP